MFSISRFLKRWLPTRTVRKIVHVQARHEALDDDNLDHWKHAKQTGPNTSSDDRAKLRNKVRHERENSGNLDAILQQYSGEFIGSGPRLRFDEDTEGIEAWAPAVERSFAKWAGKVDLAGKLSLLVESEPGDGDSFLQMLRNPMIDHPVKLDLRNIEAEQVATPDRDSWLDPEAIDGIRQDGFGNVIGYDILRVHPGNWIAWGAEYDTVPAESVCHWYRPIRAGELRGSSKLASTIEDLATLRRFRKATVQKQEAQACVVVSMEIDAKASDIAGPEADPNAPADGEDDAFFKLGDNFPLPRQGGLTFPKDSKVQQFQPSNTTTNYEEFCDKEMTSGGRPLLAPRNYMTGDSSGFNFASGKLDRLPWQDSLLRKRERLRHLVLAKIVKMWAAFALFAGELPDGTPPFSEWVFDFEYDAFSSIDTIKDLDAAEKRIALGFSNLSIECAAQGYDWRQVARQRAKEIAFYKQLGLDPAIGAKPSAPVPAPAPATKPVADDENDPALEDTTLERQNSEAVNV